MAHTFKLEPTDDDYCSEKKDEFKKYQTTPPIIPGTEIPPKEKRIPTKITLKQRKFKVNTLGCITYIIVTTISIVIVGYLIIKHQLTNQLQSKLNAKTPKIKGCDHIEVEDVWATTLPKLLTESAFRLSDVNKDGIPDFIFGFATGVDGYSIPKIVCDIYFNGTFPCYGGMMALNGEDGKELWRYYTDHEIFGINCNADLNSDGVNDCLGGGRAGVFDAVNGRTGTLLWKFKDKLVKNSIMNLYTAHTIDDLDKDGILDVLAIHGGDPLSEPGSKHRLSGRIVFFSGKSGKVLSWSGVPDEKESYYSPQVLTKSDGTKLVLFGTGGETHGGGLWLLSVNDLFYHRLENAICIFSDPKKGIMTPPVLVDLNGDGEEDIVMSLFNSHVIAFNGKTYSQLWNFSIPSSESYNTPAPGYFNDDKIPDFLIKFAHGPGFPIYYFSETAILDGRNGKSLLGSPILDTMGAQASPLTISIEGYGNDVFLFWVSDCANHEGQEGKYKFVKGTNIHEQSRSDFCRLRFKSRGYSKLLAKNQHMASTGIDIYYSGKRKHLEHQGWINTTKESIDYIKSHPDIYYNFLQHQKVIGNAEKNKNISKINKIPELAERNNGVHVDKKVYYPSKNSIRTQIEIEKVQRIEKKLKLDQTNRQKIHDKAKRIKRHVGPHDDDGIQRLLSTGTLAPTTLDNTHPNYNYSIDVVFATYWFFPAKTQAILPKDQVCISEKMDDEKARLDVLSKYYGLNHDEYERVITKECLNESDHELPQDETYESQSTYNPYNIHMGQMTVYRLRLTMSCKKSKPNEHCSRVLPFEEQQWTSYMGNKGDSHWKPRFMK